MEKEEFYEFDDELFKIASTDDKGLASFIYDKEIKNWKPVAFGRVNEAQYNGLEISRSEAQKIIDGISIKSNE